jgi:two-component system response regulator WspF
VDGVRIAIVNDVRAAGEALRRVVAGLPGHEVAWIAGDGVEAVALAKRDRPDLILMDLLMPHLDGAQATRQIMAAAPCAILIVTATVSGNISLVYEAMGYGALDAVDTPALGPDGALAGGSPLARKIDLIAKLLGPAADTRRPRPTAAAPTGAAPRLLVIGASTGGPKAVADLVRHLPRDGNLATVVVQHVDVAFAAGLARWLAEQTGHLVDVVVPGRRPVAGTVLLAGTNDHLVLTAAGSLDYRSEPRDIFFRPSVDVFFESIADHWPAPGVAVLLTGMGRDGARGMNRLRSRGWHTIAQDEATSVVWSMPKAAIDLGAAAAVLPVERMPQSILDHLR